MTTSIKNKCVRVKVSIGKQSSYITDSVLTDQVESSFSTHGRGKFIKKMFKDCLPFKAVLSSYTEIYNTYINETLPWDGAYRVVKSDELLPLMRKIGDLNKTAKDKLQAFLDNYDAHKLNDITMSGGMMKESDYPTADDLRKSFYVDTKISTITDADDFRVVEGLDDEDVKELIDKARLDEQERTNGLVREARNRLYKVVSHMTERLKEYGQKEKDRLHKSILTNVGDCIDILRKLNITNDAELDSLMDELENDVLGKTTIDRLKAFPEERNETVEKVNEIMERMKFFNKEGHNNGNV